MQLNRTTLQELVKIICINDKEDGTGTVDTNILKSCFKEFSYIDDYSQENKWKRLLYCFEYFVSNNSPIIQKIIQYLMNPQLYINFPKQHNNKLVEINRLLSFNGINIGKDGVLRYSKGKATTINEVEKRLKDLQDGLNHIELHRYVIKYCDKEYLQDNYFHCILEASKSIFVRIREKTKLKSDGEKLIEEAFGHHNQDFQKLPPYLAFTSLVTLTDKSDHFGFIHLMKAVGKIFRNITAHEPAKDWHKMSKIDAIEALTMISYIHKRLDKVHDI